MMMSQGCLASAARISCAFITRSEHTVYPALVKARSVRDASLGESSTCRTRNTSPIGHAPHTLGRRLVQEQPIQGQLLHGVQELIEVHRLANVAVDPRIVARGDILLLVG